MGNENVQASGWNTTKTIKREGNTRKPQPHYEQERFSPLYYAAAPHQRCIKPIVPAGRNMMPILSIPVRNYRSYSIYG